MNNILLADSNPILRSALALLLETRLDVQIVGQVSSMESLLCEAAVTQPDLIIISMELPGKPTQDRIAILRGTTPRASFLFSSARPEYAGLTDGSSAFLCQADPPETILATIQNLLASLPARKPRHDP